MTNLVFDDVVCVSMISPPPQVFVKSVNSRVSFPALTQFTHL